MRCRNSKGDFDLRDAVTEDTLLDGRVRLRQRRGGYRVAIDPVLLAAAVPARDGERVLDAGAGTGAAALCLAARVDGVLITGIELLGEHLRLARENVALNHRNDRIEIVAGDVASPPAVLAAGAYHHVMANPPHLPAAAARPSPDPGKAAANIEGDADLAVWIRFCLSMAREGGTVTLIHRADRAAEVIAALANGAGDLVTLPLLPAGGRPAKRVIVQARKGAGAEASEPRLLPGLVLHTASGGYTDAAEAVLRGGAALDLNR